MGDVLEFTLEAEPEWFKSVRCSDPVLRKKILDLLRPVIEEISPPVIPSVNIAGLTEDQAALLKTFTETFMKAYSLHFAAMRTGLVDLAARLVIVQHRTGFEFKE